MIRRRSRLTVGAALLTAALCYPFIDHALAQASPTSAELTTPVDTQPEIVSIVVPDMGTFGGDVSMPPKSTSPRVPGRFPCSSSLMGVPRSVLSVPCSSIRC